MRSALTQVLCTSLLALGATAARAEPPAPAGGGDATAVVRALEDAMGGREKWERLRYLRFDWAVERGGKEVSRVRHLWDRQQGRYRVEWRDREGRLLQAILDVNTRAGKVWTDGQLEQAPRADSLLERAYGRFINDTYWFVMPWKLQDPGVRLEHLGAATQDGRECDLLHLSFDRVGLTPGDQYWVWIERGSHRLVRWAYFLEGTAGEPSQDKATAWEWRDWQAVGGVQFAADRVRVGGPEPARIFFPVLAAPPRVDDAVFDSIDMPLPDAAPR
jgi:hypothetical protein